MTRRIRIVLLAAALATGLALPVGAGAQPADPPAAEPDAEPGAAGYEPAAPRALSAHEGPTTNVERFATFFDTDYVSAGVGGLRGIGEGEIELTGVTGTVTGALLYWQGPTDSSDTGANSVIRFDGDEVVGTSIGFSNDNCWGFANSQAYRASVSDIVDGDGTYRLEDLVKPGRIDINGASLLVFFDDGDVSNNRNVTVYNGNDSNIDNPFDAPGWNVLLDAIPYEGGTAGIELHVSDGQTFRDDDVLVDGTVLVPGPAAFNGDTVPGGPGPTGNGSLWDIRSFDLAPFLTLGNNDVLVTTGVVSDCLSLVLAVVDLESSGLSIRPSAGEGLAGTGAIYAIRYVDTDTGAAISGTDLVISVIDGPNAGDEGDCLRITFIAAGCRTNFLGLAGWFYFGDPDGFGEDTIRVFADDNGNGVQDAGEPAAVAKRFWYEPVRYVALGDSYASGEGAEDYFDGTDEGGVNECHRSRNAYATLVQTPGYPGPNANFASYPNSDWDFIACSGARTYHVYADTYPGFIIPRAQWDEGNPQLGQAPVTADRSLVTISIGGNDAEFGDIIEKCGANACTSEDYQPYDDIPFTDWVTQKALSVGDRLDITYAELSRRMPDATVFVMGYPQVFPDSGPEQGCFKLRPWRGEMDFLRGVGDLLDGVVGGSAAAAGFHYVSAAAWFSNHEVCGDGGEWIRGLSLPIVESYHPNAEGQRQYWRLLDNFIEEIRRTGAFPILPNGLPENPPAIQSFSANATAAQQAPAELTTLGDLDVEPVAPHPAGTCDDSFTYGETVRVTGDGFAPGATVALTYEMEATGVIDLGTVVADGTGAVDEVVTLPVPPEDGFALIQALGAEADGGDLALLGSFVIEATLSTCDQAGPTATIVSPADGATFTAFEEVVVDYSCSADAVACISWLEPGDTLPTTALGTFEFRVTAMAEDGTANSTTHTYRVLAPDESAEGILEAVIEYLQGLVDADPESDLADELEDVIEELEDALAELRRDPPDPEEAAEAIADAVEELVELLDDGEFADPETAGLQVERLVVANRILAVRAIEAAADAGAPIAEAEEALAEGDAHRDAGRLEDAAEAYADAVEAASEAVDDRDDDDGEDDDD